MRQNRGRMAKKLITIVMASVFIAESTLCVYAVGTEPQGGEATIPESGQEDAEGMESIENTEEVIQPENNQPQADGMENAGGAEGIIQPQADGTENAEGLEDVMPLESSQPQADGMENSGEAEGDIQPENEQQEAPLAVSEEPFSVKTTVNGYEVASYEKNNIYYLFLPYSPNAGNVQIQYTGNLVSVDNGTLDAANHMISVSYTDTLNINAKDEAGHTYQICVMQSDLPSCNIDLREGLTLDTIHQDKEIKYKGNKVTLTDPSGAYNLEAVNVEMKGRGNHSWLKMPKKGYQIKFESKTDVLGMGKAKKWVLLANYGDNTLMRNKLLYDLANDTGLAYTQQSRWIDLWIDGAYMGNYLICEKVENGDSRVALQDDYGVLVELDNNYYAEEPNYFAAKQSGAYFVLKESVADDAGEPGSISEVAFRDFENNLNLFESYLYADTKDWEKISGMIDVDSFIKYYFIQEFSENADGGRSSVYLYKDGANDKLHIGPVWDFDLAMANCDKENWGGNPEKDYMTNIKKIMNASVDWYAQLFQIPEFRQRVLEVYTNEIKSHIEGIPVKIDEAMAVLSYTTKMNFIRWDSLGKENAFGAYRGHHIKDTWEEEVAYMEDWIVRRIAYMNQRYSSESPIVKVSYKSYVQSNGWEKGVCSDSEITGMIGQSLSLEGIQISLDSFRNGILNGSNITYRTHMQKTGWTEWQKEGEVSGAPGENRRMEAVQIRLTDQLAAEYDIYYRAHVQTYGWLDWAKNGETAGTEGYSKRLEGLQICLVRKGGEAPGPTGVPCISKEKKLTYSTHVQNYGWMPECGDGEVAGTTNESKRLEAITLKIKEEGVQGGITYRTHVQTYGWQSWRSDGEIAGTNGESKRLEAIEIKLTGQMAEMYDVYYRVHAQRFGWLDWAKNGEPAGTEGYSRRLEAIQVKLVKKNEPAPGTTGDAYRKAKVSYTTHVQNLGWKAKSFDGELSGTEGLSKRLEGIMISNKDLNVEGNVEYRTHVQTYGWENDWKSNGQLSGTTGESKRLEAIQIRLTGQLAEKYDVYYRVHIQNYGWLGWAKNGESAGSEGLSKRLEAIEIQYIEKGSEAPGSEGDAFLIG